MKHMEITDGDYQIHVYKWDKVTSPIGVVQIIQGINENGERYDHLAKALNKGGYIVYTHDAYGQGLSRNPRSRTVTFGQRGYLDLVSNIYATRKRILVENRGLPIYVIGHSLGASLLRYILIEDLVEYDKVILSGNGLTKYKGLNKAIMFGESKALMNPEKPSRFFTNNLRKTQLKIAKYVDIDLFIDYLTRDKEQNLIDHADPYLFIPLSVSAYVEIFKLFKFVNSEKNHKHTNPAVRVLLLSGTHDPITDFGKDTKKLKDVYYQMGIYSKLILYKEARHDLFNEINRDEIFKDILEFLNN